MSHKWKFLPIAALVAIGAFMLVLGGATPKTAYANINDVSLDDDTLTVEADANSGDLVVTLSSIESDTETSMEITDCNNCQEEGDDDETTLTIDTTDPDFDETVVITLDISCPDSDNITITVTTDGTGEEDSEEVVYECEPAGPTATATSAVGPAATVKVSSSNNDLGCGATSIVTITVLDSGGKAVAAGTLVNIVADRGSVSPASGQTTADGSVFVFYTASSTQGGEATITAASGAALGTATIDVECNTAPTQAPPPTQATGGSIQPPNTGDGGLSTSNTWQPYAGVALILSSVIATLAAIRPRRA